MSAQNGSSSGKKIFGVGIPTLMVALTSLALTAFAALSLVSAGADLRMSKRLAENARLYAAADAQAEATLAAIDEILALAFASSDDGAYSAECATALSGYEGLELSGGECSFQVTVDERHALEVRLSLVKGQDSRFEIVSWQLIDTLQWQEHYEGLPVWTGEGEMP